MKHSMARTLRKATAALAVLTMLSASATELPAFRFIKADDAITANAYLLEYTKNINTDARYFGWPLAKKNNKVTGAFDDGRRHGAIDISAVKGEAVYASAPGIVVDARSYCSNGYGQYIIVKHTLNGTDYYTQYSHLSKVQVVNDQKVIRGQKIGETGDTDSWGSYHLDFQIRRVKDVLGEADRMGQNLDPLKVLQLPNTIRNGADKNPEHVGNYIAENVNHDHCPSLLKTYTQGTLNNTVQCEQHKYHKLGRKQNEAWHANVSDPVGWMVYGPYEKYNRGNKIVSFRLKEDFNTDRVWRELKYFADEVVCKIQVSDHSDNQRTLAETEIRRSDFVKSNVYQDFNLSFYNNYPGHQLEFRIYYYKKAAIWADSITVRDF